MLPAEHRAARIILVFILPITAPGRFAVSIQTMYKKSMCFRGFIACVLGGIVMFLSSGCAAEGEGEQHYMALRRRMVNIQIAARGITDENVLKAMGTVARHRFVPPQYRSLAYADRPLPIGEGQTISQPYIVAFMTEILDLDKGERVLEIGTGSGYQAAVLAEICDHVYSIEINKVLADRARKALADAGYSSVHVRTGDGYQGWPEHAPFDAIIVTCAPSAVPEPLKQQLAEGGRIIIPVDVPFGQELVLLEKSGGTIRKREVLPVRFVPMVDEDGREY